MTEWRVVYRSVQSDTEWKGENDLKAWVLKDIGNIKLSDVEKPMPAENEVLIRVKAAGICGSDIPRIYENGAHRMPLVPGHEFAGIVEAAGTGVSPESIGKRVAVYPKIACGKCPQCRKGKPGMCRNYDYLGSRRDGAFAEYVTAPAGNLLELPDGVGFEEAAMLEPMAVAANAVRTSLMAVNGGRVGESSAAVCGLGPIGQMTLMFLKDAGFGKIFVIGKKKSQQRKAKVLGVSDECYCDSTETDAGKWLKEVSDGGVTCFFECVGRNECVNYGIEGTAPEGCVVLVGNPYSDMMLPRDTYWKILRDQLTVRGIWNSSFCGPDDDWNYALKRMKDERFKVEDLISHRFALPNLEKGLHIMRDKTEDYCKVMLIL